MKRIVVLSLIFVIGIFLTACDDNGQGTYYPDSKEMQNNLEKKDYQVSVQTVQRDEYSGTYLTAENGDEYIEFYWLNDSNGVNSIEKELEEKHSDYVKLVSLENDNEFGSLVFCSTEKAMDDAGIEIVNVKVDAK